MDREFNALLRRKLLEDIYDRMSPENKRLFVQLTMQDKSADEILQALQGQQHQLDEIRKSQSWWLDLSSNVAGNAIYDGAIWLVSRLFRRL